MSELTQKGFSLPVKTTPPSKVNPGTMVIFAHRKVGKSHALTQLEGNLILDTEGGLDFYEAMKVDISTLSAFDSVCKAFHETGTRYKYITIDTITTMSEKLINQLAVRTYNKEEGKNEDLNYDIDKLGFGKGQVYKREALRKVLDFFQKYCDTLIIVGHVADKNNTATGNLMKELDLEGKQKNVLGRTVDAIGLMTRSVEKPNTNTLSFEYSEDTLGGSRAKHLRGRSFIISELIDDELVTHWDKIFI